MNGSAKEVPSNGERPRHPRSADSARHQDGNRDPIFEQAAAILATSDDYRVLRRVPKQGPMPTDMPDLRRGIVVDVETTGLDFKCDEIIQIAALPFAFTDDGAVCGAGELFMRLCEPSVPVPTEVTRLTGLDANRLAFESVSPAEVMAAVGTAELIVAHNAAFDRRFLERFCPELSVFAWACSQTQVPWSDEGLEGAKLYYLLNGLGYFHDGHRADEDVAATLTLIASPLPHSGRTGLSHLLDALEEPITRIWAQHAPFEVKDTLKRRGYRWHDGTFGRPKGWWRDVPRSQRSAECAFLEDLSSRIIPDLADVDPFDRFSERI